MVLLPEQEPSLNLPSPRQDVIKGDRILEADTFAAYSELKEIPRTLASRYLD